MKLVFPPPSLFSAQPSPGVAYWIPHIIEDANVHILNYEYNESKMIEVLLLSVPLNVTVIINILFY